VNRDGVLDVTLVEDPVVVTVEGNPTTSSPSDSAPNNSKYIILNYLSQGKRGDKHFICKICIQRNKLYVLTAQCKEEEYVLKKKELMQAVDSFKVLML
jgi:PsbP